MDENGMKWTEYEWAITAGTFAPIYLDGRRLLETDLILSFND